jgi:hypothetical protein
VKFDFDKVIPTALYYIIEFGQSPDDATQYLDGRTPTVLREISDLSFEFSLNGSTNVNLKVDGTKFYDMNNNVAYTTGGYETLTTIGTVSSLCAGEGLILDLVYQEKILLYSVELTNETVKYYKNIWLANKSETSYAIYLNALHNALKETEDEYNVEFAI